MRRIANSKGLNSKSRTIVLFTFNSLYIMKLSTKIIIALGVLAVAGVAGYGWRQYQRISARVYDAEKQAIATHIQERAGALLAPEDFTSADTARQAEAFQKFFDEIQTANLFRIKVWNKEFVVVWSNLQETIGKRFPDNHEIKESLEGEIEFELKTAGKKEQVGERNYTDFSETYIPVKDAQGAIVGVIEVYQRVFAAQEKIRGEFRASLAVAALSALAGFAALAFVVRFAVKR